MKLFLQLSTSSPSLQCGAQEVRLGQHVRIHVRALLPLPPERRFEPRELLLSTLGLVVAIQRDGVVQQGDVVVGQLQRLLVRRAAVLEVI